ncbi:hypothetical protein [Enterovibrio norvegicus]|nr:hypothetical protein [Enterovibrio norvegicus]PML77531.1 hypothetical protein BCT69_18855 [Enterovibrio norvegicus]
MSIFLNIVGFILLITSVFVFGLKGMAAEMGIAVAASGIFLAFANLEKFSEFKGAGFEAKLREAVNEANATIDNLKEVAKPLIKTNLFALAKAGRFSEGAFKKSHDVYDQLAELQSKIGLNSQDLEISKSNYLNIHAWDMVSELSGSIERAGNNRFSVTSREIMGPNSFEVAPEIQKFNELVSGLELDDISQEQYEALKNYYTKYQL